MAGEHEVVGPDTKPDLLATPTRSPLVVQRALAVGAVDDPLEREADAVAAQVVAMLSVPDQGLAPASSKIMPM